MGFARDLQSCLRHSDIVCRWGGEEFIVLTLQPDETLHTLLSRANHAMYRAKQSGRNRTCVEMTHSSYE